MATETTPAAVDFDLRTAEGRASYGRAIVAEAGRSSRVWAGRTCARIYLSQSEYIEILADGSLDPHLTGGSAYQESKFRPYDDADTRLSESCTFLVEGDDEPVATQPASAPRACSSCRTQVQPWSDGVARGLCHDCA